MQNRAYSVLDVKSMDLDLRRLRGTATTPTVDRMGDVIEPKGIKFKNPMPLLWQHDAKAPVGWVSFADATDQGIEFEAQIASVSDDGAVKTRTDEAWQSVKTGLVRAVSIGFRPNKDGYEWMKDDSGIRFKDIEVLELSLVTIPANQDATISQIRSLDSTQLAALGTTLPGCERPVKPGATGKPKKEKAMAKTVAERISAYEATRAAKAAAMEKLIMTEDESTLSAEDQQKYDDMASEVKSIDADLLRLRDLEKTIKQSAIAVEPDTNAKHVGNMPATGNGSLGNGVARVKVTHAKVEPWQPFTRYMMTMAYAKGDTAKAIAYAKQWEDHTPEVAYCAAHDINMLMQRDMQGLISRAAIGAGTTTDATWASPLIAYTQMSSLFAAILRPMTIIGRAPLRQVPFNIQLPVASTGTTVGWVGELAPKPVSNMAFTSVTLRWAKAAGIVVLSDELIKFSAPNAEAVVRDDLTRQMVQFLDSWFVSNNAEVTNVSPAGILNGVTAVVPTGADATAFRNDIATLLNTFLATNVSLSSAFWIMTQQQAAKISMMNNTFSSPIYPTVTTTGGTLLGFPVIASENLAATTGSPAEGYPIILALGDEIMLADDGVTMIDASNQASIQLDSAPDSPPSASTAYVSLWQTNSTALRAERWITWKKRRSTCVAYIQSALYK